jgi:AcrR family transcriptional regulator
MLTVNCYGANVTTIETPSDGRTARRERNRDAVIDALLAMYDSGDLSPSLDTVAERAGVSPRSLFRYFADTDDLTRTAISRQQDRLAPLLAEPVAIASTTDARVRAAVDDRVHLLDAMGPVAQVARLRSHANPAVAAEVRDKRRILRQRLADALAPDLDRADDAAATLAAADVSCSFEAYHLLLEDHRMSPSAAAEILGRSVAAIIRSALGEAAIGGAR